MTNPFLLYRLVRAERIVKSNIRSNHIKEDLIDLLETLNPLTSLSKSKQPDGLSLDENIFHNLSAKSDTLSLLDYFGYECNDNDEYIYHSPRSEREKESRQNGINESQRFLNDLQSARNGTLDGFEEYIRNHSKRTSSKNSKCSVDEEQVPKRPSFEPSPLRHQYDLEEGNRKTIEVVKSLQKSLVTKYSSKPASNFIRRKLALLIFKQKYPDSVEAGDSNIDASVVYKMNVLKKKEDQKNATRTDDIYYECLIRSEFDENEALYMLHHNRPNLTVRTGQTFSKKSMKISIVTAVQPLKQHRRLLVQYNEENNMTKQSSRDKDEWKNAKHLIPSIQQLRKKINVENVDQASISKMHRLLFSELSRITGKQLSVKIEQLASVLCELSMDSIENLDMVTIKDILRSSGDLQVHENFRAQAMNVLSIICPICAASFPRSQMETMFLCDHICCRGCIKNYYRNTINQIRDRQSLKKLTCFECAHEITNDTSMNFFVYLEAKLNQWFSDDPEILKAYHENVFSAAHDNQIKKCGNTKCPSYFSADDNDNIACVRCPNPKCRFSQCGQCCQKWYPEHAEMECDEYRAWLIDNDPENPNVQLFKYLNASGIECPNPDCQTIFDYAPGGCEHFTCGACQTGFCRMCPALFYSPTKNQKCPQVNCTLNTLHAHCRPNCFRETRIGEIDALTKLLNDHRIDITKELPKSPVSADKKCLTENCEKQTVKASQDRLCELCYKQLLCTLIWRHELEPWEVYADNNLRQMLVKESVIVPANATRQNLIALCKQNLNRLLGKPKKLTKPNS